MSRKSKSKFMTSDDFIKFHKKVVLEMNEITKAKNTDYAGGGIAGAFENFKMVERMGIATTEQGFLTRMTDKMMRISNLIKNGGNAVLDESMSDTLMDLANYSILMIGYLEEKRLLSGTKK